MEGINNIVYQYAIGQTFQLVVIDSKHAGTYEIEEPDGFDDINSYIDINEEFFNVDNFILGESTSLEFVRYNNKDAYEIIDKVYKEKGGDGQIIFKWIVDGDDILGDDFQLNLNKVSYQYEKSSQKIVTEIKKRESQNKILSREDTSVNLFSDKNLDNKPVTPFVPSEFYFKEIRSKAENLYFMLDPLREGIQVTSIQSGLQGWQWMYKLTSEGQNIGDNTNTESGFYMPDNRPYMYIGPMLSTKTDIDDLEIRVSNVEMYGCKTSDKSTYHTMTMVALIKDSSGNIVRIEKLADSELFQQGPNKLAQVKVISDTYTNKDRFPVNGVNPLSLKAGQSIEVQFFMDFSPGETWDPNASYTWSLDPNLGGNPAKTDSSIAISANILSPLRKVKVVTLKEAINQVCKLYSDGQITIESNILGEGGIYENTGIGTGMFFRSIPESFAKSFKDKLTTSLKSLLYDSASPLLALGYDIVGNKFIVESVDYFFKDIQAFDLSNKGFDEDGYDLSNDLENSLNNLLFGSQKFSTNKKDDLSGFNTTAEFLTPIKSSKNKFDKKTDFIIDEFKIQDVINDNSSSTSDSDDDLILIDMVNVDTFTDNGIIMGCIHDESEGHLVLRSYKTPFDVLPLKVGDKIRITTGLNSGEWTILKIGKTALDLNKTTGIEKGTINTPISYTITNFIKNRSDEGFVYVSQWPDGIYSRDTTSNLRHNPKFQMARWSGFFGSALVKKLASEEILVTNYKNNGNVEIEVNPDELPNELTGRVKLNANETVGRLRNFKYPYFTNQTIEITIPYVTFEEFFRLHNNWRFGINGDRNKSRGYITVDTPEGIMDVYPFGQKGLEHNKGYNTLTIRGKIKGSSLKNKILNVVFTGPTIVQLQIFTPDEFKALPMRIKATKDNGATWETIYNGANSSNVQIDDAFFFTNIPKNRKIGFRVFSIEDGIEQYKSDDVFIHYPFGEIVVNTTKIITNPDESNCGYTYVEYEVIGEGVLEVHYKLFSEQGNGNIVVLDENDNIIVEIHAPVNAENYEHTEIVNLTLTGKSKFKATLRAASTVNEGFYTCFDNGNPFILMYATTGIRFFDNGKDFAGIGIAASGRKYRIN
ncbi:hypothetical protein HZP83_08415 [Elizabethkingia anophelis]|nr:hypothetical protein [Elizabethkingia anophelis]MCT4090919.1 hypothetical protein [Elizabethkingia anophelis]